MTDTELDALQAKLARQIMNAADALSALRAENDHLLRCVKAGDDVTSASAMELMRERAEKAEGLAADLFGKVSAANDRILQLEADNAALRRIVGLAKEMRSVMLPVDAEDDEILRRFDAALIAGKEKGMLERCDDHYDKDGRRCILPKYHEPPHRFD